MPISKKRKVKANTSRVQKLKQKLRDGRNENISYKLQYEEAIGLLSSLQKETKKLLDKREEWRKSFWIDRDDALRFFSDIKMRSPVECWAMLAERGWTLSKAEVEESSKEKLGPGALTEKAKCATVPEKGEGNNEENESPC